MWQMQKCLIVRNEVQNKRWVQLPHPHHELIEDRIIEDRELINLMTMWINIGSVTVEPLKADTEDFKQELQAEGIKVNGNIYGYLFTWVSNTRQVYEYRLEELEEEEYEDNEPETDSSSANQQLGWVGSIWNYLKGR